MMSWLHFFFLQSLAGRTILGYLLMFTVPLSLPVLFVTLVGARGLRHLFSYEPHPSIMHSLDPRLKILYPFVIGTLSVLLNWDFVYALLIFTIVPWLLVRPSSARVRVVLTMVFAPTIALIWSQGMFYITSHSDAHLLFAFPPTLSWIGTPGISSDGLLNGVQQAGRVIVALSSTLILLLTTTPAEIIWAFSKFRMPAAVGLAFTVALRFLPQLVERTTVLLQVLQVRGYDLSQPRWWEIPAWPGYISRVVIAIPTITVPLLIGSLRSTSVTAMVVDARAFGSQRERTSLQEHTLSVRDYYAIAALTALIVVSLALILLHIADRRG